MRSSWSEDPAEFRKSDKWSRSFSMAKSPTPESTLMRLFAPEQPSKEESSAEKKVRKLKV